MDRMSYEGGQSPAVSSGTVLDRCPRCNGELDTGYRCVACGWSRYTSSGNVGAYVGAPPISPLPARGALDELLADGDWEGFEPMRERVRAELAALREENARLKANRDYWHDSALQAQEHRDLASVLRGFAEAENERLREALRQAWIVLDIAEPNDPTTETAFNVLSGLAPQKEAS